MRRFSPGGLWRHPDFMKLWGAETVSQLGTHVSQLALPFVAIIILEVNAFEVALLGVIEMAPFILISLPAGVWVDRLRRKPILVVCDIGRAVLLASIPVAYWLDSLTIWQLYVVGFAVGVLTVFFDVSYQSYLPSLVEREQLLEGNAKLEVSRSGTQLAGPGIAGALIAAITAPVAVLVDAISFLGSAIFLFAIRKQEAAAPTRAERRAGPGMKEEVKEGLRWVLGNRYLRWIAASTATFNLFASIIFSIFLVFAVRELDLGPGTLGLRRRERRLPRRRAGLEQACETLRSRSDDHHGRGVLGLTALARRRACVEPDPVPDCGTGDLQHGHTDLQHHAGQLPPGDYAGATPGPDELGHALHRLGRDAARVARRRRDRDVVRVAHSDLGRRNRDVVRRAARPALAGAPSKADGVGGLVPAAAGVLPPAAD